MAEHNPGEPEFGAHADEAPHNPGEPTFGGASTLADEDIVTRGGAAAPHAGDDSTDTGDTGDDSGDTSDTGDTGDTGDDAAA